MWLRAQFNMEAPLLPYMRRKTPLYGYPIDVPIVNLAFLKPPQQRAARHTSGNTNFSPNFQLVVKNNCSLTLSLDADDSLQNLNRSNTHDMSSMILPSTASQMAPFVSADPTQNLSQAWGWDLSNALSPLNSQYKFQPSLYLPSHYPNYTLSIIAQSLSMNSLVSSSITLPSHHTNEDLSCIVAQILNPCSLLTFTQSSTSYLTTNVCTYINTIPFFFYIL